MDTSYKFGYLAALLKFFVHSLQETHETFCIQRTISMGHFAEHMGHFADS